MNISQKNHIKSNFAETNPLIRRGQGEAKIVIIKYNAGNIESVNNALNRLGVNAEITADPEKIRNADKVIFPGVGEASTTMEYLRRHKLDELIVSLKQPVLGICLGLQLMCSHSEEGDTKCLGIFDEKVKRFVPDPGQEFTTKVPHMGWNSISDLKSRLFTKEQENQYVYFVHSFYAGLGQDTAATCNYIVPFSAALQKDNFYATQFHPEKSGKIGAEILNNFLKI
jgi:glutamine amidotransferase